MTTTEKSAGTAVSPETTENCPADTYGPTGSTDTQQPMADEAPQPYARIITAPAAVQEVRVSVLYDHARTLREMAFLRLNEILDARRK